MKRSTAILARWWWLLQLGVLGALTLVALAPFDLLSGRVDAIGRPENYPWWLAGFLQLLVPAVLLLVALPALRLGATPLRLWWQYPPLWIAVVLGLSLGAGVLRLVRSPAPTVPATMAHPEWLWAAAVGLMLLAVLRRAWTSRSARAGNDEVPITLETDWNALARWSAREGPVAAGHPDLFGGRPVARRIARLLSQPWGEDCGVALLGPFGSGKSSVLGWVKRELATGMNPRVWFCEVQCWGLDTSSVAPTHVLEVALAEVERHVETFALRGLPRGYQRLLTAEPSGLGGKLAEIVSPATDADRGLRQLSEILRAADARLVICIEDAERADDDFDPQHVQRLLWRLRDVPGVSFVLAVDPREVRFDFAKVCDHVERMPLVDAEQVRHLLRMVRDHCMTERFIDPVNDRATDNALDLNASSGDLESYARRRYRNSLADAILDLLETPRKLKHVVRRVARAWRGLRGEVDIDDLIVVSALREGAPDSFDFLVSELDAVRHKERDWPQPSTAIQDAWKKHVESLPNGALVQRLVDFLALEAIAQPNAKGRPQGVAHDEPNDYFRRVLAEELAGDELRDQQVLREMDAWIAGSSDEMTPRLLAATESDRRYVRVWEHFSDRVPDDKLLPLASTLLEALRKRDGVRTSGKHPAVLALWRTANRHLGRTSEASKWLSTELAAALAASLELAHELYYFWGSVRYSVVDEAGRSAARAAVVEAARSLYADPEELRKALDDERPWGLRHLLEPVDQEEPKSVLTDPSAWAWLGPVLLDLIRLQGPALAAHLLRLIGDVEGGHRLSRSNGVESWTKYSLNRDRTMAIFGARTGEVLAFVAGLAVAEADFESARPQAAQWIAEPLPHPPAPAPEPISGNAAQAGPTAGPFAGDQGTPES
jgi:hypothetical protein